MITNLPVIGTKKRRPEWYSTRNSNWKAFYQALVRSPCCDQWMYCAGLCEIDYCMAAVLLHFDLGFQKDQVMWRLKWLYNTWPFVLPFYYVLVSTCLKPDIIVNRGHVSTVRTIHSLTYTLQPGHFPPTANHNSPLCNNQSQDTSVWQFIALAALFRLLIYKLKYHSVICNRSTWALEEWIVLLWNCCNNDK